MSNKKIYVASPIKNNIINRKISKAIKKHTKFSIFLPESLNLIDSIETIDLIADKCYNEIDISDVLLIVSPYGLSTAAEIGYGICKIKNGKPLKIILFNPNKFELKVEAAINPFINKMFYSQKELIKYLNKLFEEL